MKRLAYPEETDGAGAVYDIQFVVVGGNEYAVHTESGCQTYGVRQGNAPENRLDTRCFVNYRA
jgi:hypothetical protein